MNKVDLRLYSDTSLPFSSITVSTAFPFSSITSELPPPSELLCEDDEDDEE